MTGACSTRISRSGDLYVLHREDLPVYEKILDCTSETIVVCADITKLTKEHVWKFANIGELVKRHPTVSLVTNDPRELASAEEQDRARQVLEALSQNSSLDVIVAPFNDDGPSQPTGNAALAEDDSI